MEGHPHRCEYPETGETIDGVTYDGLTPKPTDDGQYCYCPVTHKITLGEIVKMLDSFKEHSETLMVPDFTPGSFEKKLYSMYLSYLPATNVSNKVVRIIQSYVWVVNKIVWRK